MIFDLAQDLQKSSTRIPTRESREFIGGIGIATTISFLRISHDSNRFRSIPIDSTPRLGHRETSRGQASKRVRCLGTLEAESRSYGKVLRWLSIVYWQLSLGLYIVYA